MTGAPAWVHLALVALNVVQSVGVAYAANHCRRMRPAAERDPVAERDPAGSHSGG